MPTRPSEDVAQAESNILRSYLFDPASLRTIITPQEFMTLFPTTYQYDPQVLLLYADLQVMREVDTDLVRENIEREVRDGGRQRRELWRALYQQEKAKSGSGGAQGFGEGDKEVITDEALYGPTGGVARRAKRHTKETLFKEMEETLRYLEVDALVMGREAEKALGGLRETVGGLSDLRYGKFSGSGKESGSGGLEDEVVKSLKGLEDAVNKAQKGP